jgi:biopolymer transport protein ExbB
VAPSSKKKVAMTLHYLAHLADYSDGVLYVMMGLLLIALTVIIDRFWYLRRTILRGDILCGALSSRAELDRATLRQLTERAGDLPEGTLLQCALRHHGLVRGEALANRLEETILLTSPCLDRRLWLLDTIVTLAPLLGLFGTIIGMFHAFSVLAKPGHAPTRVTGGVADALVATASGLFIAMLGLVAYNAFSNQVRQIVNQLDSLKTVLLNRMDGEPVVVEGPAGALPDASALGPMAATER